MGPIVLGLASAGALPTTEVVDSDDGSNLNDTDFSEFVKQVSDLRLIC